MPIEEPYDVLIMLAIPFPMAAGIAIGLIALIHQVTGDMSPLRRRFLRWFGFLAGASCALINTATSMLWLWSWQYFEDPNGDPAGVDKALDAGFLAGGFGLILPSTVAAVALLLRARTRSPAHAAIS